MKLIGYSLVGVLASILLNTYLDLWLKDEKSTRYLRYGCVAVGNALGYSLAAQNFENTIEALLICLLISMTLVLNLIDLYHFTLPTSIIKATSIVVICIRSLQAFIIKDCTLLFKTILGGLLGYLLLAAVFFTCLYLFKKEGLGYGDVRYLGMLGLFTSPIKVYMILFIASLIGSLWGGLLYLKNKKSSPFPFGPSIGISGVAIAFFGDSLLKFYISI